LYNNKGNKYWHFKPGVMKNRKQAKTEADKFVDRVKDNEEGKQKATHVKVKPEIVKDIPNDIGRHGSDHEKELNPEE
jgi:hypothetical protein